MIAKTDKVLMGGYNLACALRNIAPSGTTQEIETTTLCTTFQTYESGFKTGELTAEGKFASDSVNLDQIHDVFVAAFQSGAANVITAGIGFYAFGGPAMMMDACETEYDIPQPVGGLILSNAKFRSTNGMSNGKWLMSQQIDAGTVTGASLDNTAATTNGGLFHVQLQNTAVGGATDVDVKVQHSTDNSTWVDLTAVNNLSAIHAAGSITVARGTTVRRYLRAVATVTGGNTVLVSAAFARRY